jgi:opacity protein-like surface antigen
MRNGTLLIALLLGVSLTASAQQVPLVEVFGGYSYARVDGPTFDTTLSGVAPVLELGDIGNFSTNGFHLAFSENMNDWFGGVVEVSGHFGDRAILDVVNLESRQYTVLFGPRFFFRRTDRLTPFVHGMIGLSNFEMQPSVDVNEVLDFLGLTPTDPSIGRVIFPTESQTELALAMGGGLDIGLSRRFAVRVAQVDYIGNRFDTFEIDVDRLLTGDLGDFGGFTGRTKWKHNIRVSAGIVIRFGERR